MKVDLPLLVPSLAEVPAEAARLAAVGADGAITEEGQHQPIIPRGRAAAHTPHERAPANAHAIPPSPQQLAHVAHHQQG
jgi:hypothetical protein